MELLRLELEARILWRTGRVFKFLKWPSAHEVDFGEFVVDYEFKNGLVFLRYPSGRVEQIASFNSQKRGASITGIEGPIRVADDYLVELQPATDAGAISIGCAMVDDETWSHELAMDRVDGDWSISDKVRLVSVVEGRDDFLKVSYTEGEYGAFYGSR